MRCAPPCSLKHQDKFVPVIVKIIAGTRRTRTYYRICVTQGRSKQDADLRCPLADIVLWSR